MGDELDNDKTSRPLCGESIDCDAYYCRYCKRNLPTIDGKPSFDKAGTADPDSVENQLKALGDFHQWFTRKEILHLPAVLSKGEKIKALTSGLYQGNTWLITVTDQRLLFLDKGMVFGLKQVELPLRQISALSHKTGLMYGEIHIATGGGNSVIQSIPKGEVAKVASVISALVRDAQQPKAPTVTASPRGSPPGWPSPAAPSRSPRFWPTWSRGGPGLPRTPDWSCW
jgi:hypothetical protein